MPTNQLPILTIALHFTLFPALMMLAQVKKMNIQRFVEIVAFGVGGHSPNHIESVVVNKTLVFESRFGKMSAVIFALNRMPRYLNGGLFIEMAFFRLHF
jgi:hypothetical protein